ncbi:MAG: enoyl-CoA hydratase [Rhodospirillaceae bacterium]|jgi:enoyl-CoA hydratase|nr:enoyl-CoA hydratase [Rhodospirillaceae bacterium]MBT5665425.1 enoyl-CoA hydratase [Rhodospirillaceae bacterium]
MSYKHIRYETGDFIARITTNRPKYRNAQSTIMMEEMDDAFQKANFDPDVRVIAMFGEGDHFSAGHDLGTPEETEYRKSEYLIQEGVRGRYNHTREQFVDKTMRWRNVQKPTIAGVQGYCIFGGWIIASAMDIVFAAEDAMFLPVNFQYFSVPWDIHPRKVKEILFEGRFIDAAEAHELGFVNRVVTRDRLEAEVMEYAAKVAKNDPFQMRMTKNAVNGMQDAQGFHQHITSAHAMFLLSSQGEKDPDFAVEVPDGRRRPMVQRALENYREKQTKDGNK